MNTLLEHPLVVRLGWTLLHFLWQGAAVAAAFALLGLNQALAAFLGASGELTPYTYVLRVFGFVLILYAIVDKNITADRKPRPSQAR